MDLNSTHLADLSYWALALYIAILILALIKAPWSILKQKDASNVLFATSTMIFLIWHLRVHVEDGLALHLLGSTLLTLMFRWQAALLANALILIGTTLSSSADFLALGVNGIIMGVIPITISHFIWRFNERFMPANYFVYIFIAAFIGAGVSMFCVGVMSYELLKHLDNQLIEEVLDQYIWIYIPIMYPEAFITGGAMSIFVLYKPEWIATYDDRRYMINK